MLNRLTVAFVAAFFLTPIASGRGDSGAREPNTTRHNSDGRPCAKLDDSIRPTTSLLSLHKPNRPDLHKTIHPDDAAAAI